MIFAFQSCAEHMLHFTGRLFASNPWKLLWSSIYLESSHSLSHTTLTMNSHIKYRMSKIEQITIKFGTELKPIQISYKSQLYKINVKLYGGGAHNFWMKGPKYKIVKKYTYICILLLKTRVRGPFIPWASTYFRFWFIIIKNTNKQLNNYS